MTTDGKPDVEHPLQRNLKLPTDTREPLKALQQVSSLTRSGLYFILFLVFVNNLIKEC